LIFEEDWGLVSYDLKSFVTKKFPSAPLFGVEPFSPASQCFATILSFLSQKLVVLDKVHNLEPPSPASITE
jgi:hypothetical protein